MRLRQSLRLGSGGAPLRRADLHPSADLIGTTNSQPNSAPPIVAAASRCIESMNWLLRFLRPQLQRGERRVVVR